MEQVKDSVNTIKGAVSQGDTMSNALWLYVAIIGIMAIILSIIYLMRRNNKKRRLKNKVMDETANIDFKNITHGWEKSKQLYDILKKKCHPDKFSDDLKEEATRIFQLIGKNKYNYQELLKIKDEAINNALKKKSYICLLVEK